MGTRYHLARVASLAVLLGLAVAPSASADDASWLYEPTTITEIDLTLPQASIDALEADPTGDYQPGTFSIAETDGVPGSAGPFTTPLEVGIRLKGSLGSLRNLHEKAAFKIKFDEFVDDQTFLGLEKMTLNNMVQDPSMVHETLAYEGFRALGVPATHTGFAYLHVNGEDFGMHLNVETLDKLALEKRFGKFLNPPQHLYEGEYGADVTPARVADFEVDEGKKNEKADLEALVAAVDGGAVDWFERVGAHADLDEMTRMWAIEKYQGHWDGYSGTSGALLPNNYYLYSDPGGSFQMIPWGTDQTWGLHLSFDGGGGALFNGCLADAECEPLYREAAAEVLPAFVDFDFDRAARCTAARLKPWQNVEANSSRQPFDSAEIAAAVAATRGFIATRPQELADWLGDGVPAAPPLDPTCPPLRHRLDASAPASPAGPAATPVAALSPARGVLLLQRTGYGRGALRARFGLPAPGRISVRGTIGADSRRVRACSGSAVASAAGSTLVTCDLNARALERLADHRLHLRLRAIFTAATGPAESITRSITLPRT